MKTALSDRPFSFPDCGDGSTPGVGVEVRRYRRSDGWLSRYWAVYVDGELLAVVLYRKGALAIAAALRRA